MDRQKFESIVKKIVVNYRVNENNKKYNKLECNFGRNLRNVVNI